MNTKRRRHTALLWDMTPRQWVIGSRRFEGKLYHYLQGLTGFGKNFRPLTSSFRDLVLPSDVQG